VYFFFFSQKKEKYQKEEKQNGEFHSPKKGVLLKYPFSIPRRKHCGALTFFLVLFLSSERKRILPLVKAVILWNLTSEHCRF
jgi:hypothetical protein